MSYYIIWSLFLVQRLSEMILAKKNMAQMTPHLLTPVNQTEKRNMLLLHSTWFVSILMEYIIHGEFALTINSNIILFVLGLCQLVRWRSMQQLKTSWVPYPVSFKNQVIILEGIYKWVRHPNYLIVILEILLVPLLGKCYYSAIIFTILNLIFILKRINLEESQLVQHENYKRYQQSTKKLVPFIY